jgi:hypothetical protein
MWRQIRILGLLLVLAMVAFSAWYDRDSTTDWDETLWIGVFPISADDSEAASAYISALDASQLAAIEKFINREARRHGIGIERPVRVDLYPRVHEKPPPLDPDPGVFATMWWSLEMRMYARRASRASGRPPPQIRVFVLFHDPELSPSVPHSVGLQKGLTGVVHAFAARDQAPTNNVVIAHEILHTLGASDKYHPQTLAPLFAIGYADPGQQPLYPQMRTEIMAGRRAIDAEHLEIPESLDEVIVGDATALEIRWKKP